MAINVNPYRPNIQLSGGGGGVSRVDTRKQGDGATGLAAALKSVFNPEQKDQKLKAIKGKKNWVLFNPATGEMTETNQPAGSSSFEDSLADAFAAQEERERIKEAKGKAAEEEEAAKPSWWRNFFGGGGGAEPGLNNAFVGPPAPQAGFTGPQLPPPQGGLVGPPRPTGFPPAAGSQQQSGPGIAEKLKILAQVLSGKGRGGSPAGQAITGPPVQKPYKDTIGPQEILPLLRQGYGQTLDSAFNLPYRQEIADPTGLPARSMETQVKRPEKGERSITEAKGTGPVKLSGRARAESKLGIEGKPLDQATAQKILKGAGGDKEKARRVARALGYTF